MTSPYLSLKLNPFLILFFIVLFTFRDVVSHTDLQVVGLSKQGQPKVKHIGAMHHGWILEYSLVESVMF